MVLHKVIEYKRSFLITFFITIPIVSILLIQSSRFQLFPDMDSNNIKLSVKLEDSIPIEITNQIAKK